MEVSPDPHLKCQSINVSCKDSLRHIHALDMRDLRGGPSAAEDFGEQNTGHQTPAEIIRGCALIAKRGPREVARAIQVS
jgi:hypothetical protein